MAEKDEERLTVSVEGESIAVSMQEVLDSERHVLTPAEEKHPWMAPKCDYKLTGRLRLSVDSLPYSSHARATWADGKIQIVENCIGDFIVGLKVAAAAIKKAGLNVKRGTDVGRKSVKRRKNSNGVLQNINEGLNSSPG
jgi:hypothetical protein